MNLIVKNVFKLSLILMVSTQYGVLAQTSDDTLDVAEGFETLNLAIEGDTPNPNRVYRLARGGTYLLNGAIAGLADQKLRIVAAHGTGARPMLIPAANTEGSSSQPISTGNDAEFKGLYIAGYDNLGNQVKNVLKLSKEGGHYLIDNCFLDGDRAAFVRMNATGQRVHFTNNIARNSTRLDVPTEGRLIDTRGNDQHTVFVQNNTFYLGTDDIFRNINSLVHHLTFDHNTVYNAGGHMTDGVQVWRTVHATVTNNVFMNVGFEGDHSGYDQNQGDPNGVDPYYENTTGLDWSIVGVDTLGANSVAMESDRSIMIKNNVYGWQGSVKTFIESKPELDFYVFHDTKTQGFIDAHPNMTSMNNSRHDDIVFSDPLEDDIILNYLNSRWGTGYLNETGTMTDPRYDRNGFGVLSTNPETVGPHTDEYDFDYETTHAAYTAGIGGFPVGDLNWFPAKLSEWKDDLEITSDDTLDVAEGFETLNLAIEGDTPNPNRVYRLARGGTYLLNGAIAGLADQKLRIVAAHGTGARPMLIPAANTEGSSSQPISTGNDAEFKGLYIAGYDNLGNQVKNVLKLSKEGGHYLIDNCFLDGDRAAFVRMNATGQRVHFTNNIARNSTRLDVPTEGRLIDTRGNDQHTVFVQNNTFYLGTDDIFRNINSLVHHLTFDHNTVYNAGGHMTDGVQVWRTVHATVTNNVFMNVGFEGDHSGYDQNQGDPNGVDPYYENTTGLDWSIVGVDTLGANSVAMESDRSIMIKNNVYGWQGSVKTFIESKPELDFYVFHDTKTQGFIDAHPNMTSMNNSRHDDIVFSDPLEDDIILNYLNSRWGTGYLNETGTMTDPRYDRNGFGVLSTNPETVGPHTDEYDFDYETTHAAYTAGIGGFPVGDLNWFPAKLSEWKDATLNIQEDVASALPTHFRLMQNFPNPFNPTTNIQFEILERTDIKLELFDVMGKNVATLFKGSKNPGLHQIKWNGTNDQGQLLSTGIYFYKLTSKNLTQTRKLLFAK